MSKPKKKVETKKPLAEPKISYSIEQITYEINTIRMLMEEMTDADLFDFCAPHAEMYQHDEVDALYPKLASGMALTQKERTRLEGFAILANSSMCLEDSADE